ncbi:MAG: type III secretion system chaperone [Acidiferrobacterales bacterium]
MKTHHNRSGFNQVIAGQLVMSSLLAISIFASPVFAKKDSGSMSNQRLGKIIKRLDTKATGQPGYWKLSIDGVKLIVITDERADRMRIIAPITSAQSLSTKKLYRLMQANFDTALDARYSIAKSVLWSTFIHPLKSLSDREFISGIGQVVNLGQTYGGNYTSGALVFRGGDSETLQKRKLIDRLMEKGLVL